MMDTKVINLNGVEYEVRFETVNNDVNHIHSVQVLAHKDIYDHLDEEIREELFQKIHERDYDLEPEDR